MLRSHVGRRLEVLGFGCDAVSEVEPQGLAMTYWLDPEPAGTPHATTITFYGRRTAGAKAGRGDTFSIEESLEVLPGAGPMALTARVEGLRAGTWQVTAAELSVERRQGTRPGRARRAPRGQASVEGATIYAPIASALAPGTHLGAWPALVGVGWVVALIVQALLARHLGVEEPPLLTVVASIIGLAGAKGYYAAGHLIKGERNVRRLLGGSCIQGFVLALAVSLAVGAWLWHVPLGGLFDSAAPALMFGMAIGRYGCFFGGCCAGRPTSSRWGLRSSNKRVLVRRDPVQLLESSLALALGVTGLLVLWSTRPAPPGVLFVGLVAAYTLSRQLLFPLRDQPRYTVHGRLLVLSACVLFIVADVTIGLVGS